MLYWVSRSKRGSWHRAASARVPQRGQPGGESDLDDKKVPIFGREFPPRSVPSFEIRRGAVGATPARDALCR